MDVLFPVTRSRWVVDREPPIFTEQRDYIEQHVVPRTKETE